MIKGLWDLWTRLLVKRNQRQPTIKTEAETRRGSCSGPSLGFAGIVSLGTDRIDLVDEPEVSGLRVYLNPQK